MAKKRPDKKRTAKGPPVKPAKAKTRPAKMKRGSAPTGDFVEGFRTMLKVIAENPLGDLSLRDRYPEEMVEKAKQISGGLLEKAFETVASGKAAPDQETNMELLFESDRGCVLIASAWIDEIISEMTRDVLCEGDDARAEAGQELLKSYKAPLGDAWSKETLLFAIGYIRENERDALAAIRRLRNRYAHRTAPAVLTDQEVDVVLRHLDDEDRATVDYMGNQLGVFFLPTVVAQHQNFGLRFAPSPAKMRFILGFTKLKGYLKIRRDIFKLQGDGVKQAADRAFATVMERKSKEAQSQDSRSEKPCATT